MNPDTRKFLSTQMIWIGISLAISVALSIILPFPISLVAIIGVFLSISYFMRKQQMRRMGMGGGLGRSFLGGLGGEKTINFYCLGCGHRHNQTRCPKCGSTMRRADF
jgi:hypothetical protein